MADLPDIAERLGQLTVMEAVALAKMLEEKWGVSGAPVAPITQTIVEKEPEAEAQTEFSVTLVSVDPAKKIAVIKEIRTLTQLGLKEAKEFVDTAPKVIREAASKVDADAMKEKIEAAGGVVEIK